MPSPDVDRFLEIMDRRKRESEPLVSPPNALIYRRPAMTARKSTTLVYVNVPQEDGDITISTNGGEPETFTVHSGRIRVERGRVPEVLSVIAGSTPADPADFPEEE